MAFEPKSADFELKYAKTIGTETVPVAMTLTNGEGVISRVVSIHSTPYVEQVVANTGSVQIDGKLCAKVIVELVDGGYSCLEGTTNFSIHNMNAEITPESEIFALVYNVGVNNVQASEQSVTLSVNVLARIKMLCAERVKYIEDLPTAQVKRESLNYSDIVAATTQEFELETEFDLPSSISKILCVESRLALNRVEAGTDVITLAGEIYSNLVYLTNDEQPKLKNQRYVQTFSHELLANNITADDRVSATIQNCTLSYEVQGELNSAKSTIILKNTCKTNIFVYQNKSVELIGDAFCPNYFLNSEYSSFISQEFSGTELTFEKVDGSITLGEDSARIDRVLSVNAGNVVVKNYEVAENEVSVSGVLTSNIIYTLDDDTGSTQSVFAEVPFNVIVKHDGINENSEITLNVVPKEIEARNKKSKEIDILAEIAIELTFAKNKNDGILQSMSLGDKRPTNTSAIGLYIIPEAEDLWSISKALAIPSEMIMAQNPDLTFPITSPQRIIIYKEKHL